MRPPVPGVLAASYAQTEGAAPGTFAFEGSSPTHGLFYICPCGCGNDSFIRFTGYDPLRPKDEWSWDGNRQTPTLTPSIRHLSGCRWHGYLTAGVWTFCEDSGVGSPPPA